MIAAGEKKSGITGLRPGDSGKVEKKSSTWSLNPAGKTTRKQEKGSEGGIQVLKWGMEKKRKVTMSKSS